MKKPIRLMKDPIKLMHERKAKQRGAKRLTIEWPEIYSVELALTARCKDISMSKAMQMAWELSKDQIKTTRHK